MSQGSSQLGASLGLEPATLHQSELQTAPSENKVQLTAYAKVDAIRGSWPDSHPGLPVLVRVVAPPGKAKRAPIDLVAVLDVRCGGMAPTNRMDLLKRAMEHVIDKLSSQDRLAVVPVQTSAVLEKDDLIKMNTDGRKEAAARVESLVVSGDNKLPVALKKAAGILEGRTEEEKKSASFIILISDGDDSSIFRETMISAYSVHAFGFRDAHNASAMHYIANSSTGTYGILNDEHDQITEAFTASVNKMTSIVAVQTEVDIACANSSTAKLSAIESGRFKWHIEDNRKEGFIKVGDLQAGAVRNFIVYVDNVREDEYNELPRLLTVRVKYQHGLHTAASRVEDSLDGQVVVVRKGTDGSKEVAAEIVRVEAVRIVGDILLKYKDNGKGFVDAVHELREQWIRVKESEYGREAGAACLISGLAAEMEEMEASMRRCSGLSYMLSWQARHTLQHQTRSTSVASPAAKGSQQSPALQQQSPAPQQQSPAPQQQSPEPQQQSPAPQQLSLPKGMVGRAALDTFMAASAHAKAGADRGSGSRKRKYQDFTELEMIEQRLAYWSKVKCDLPPMLHDGAGDCPDQITMVFQEASRETIDRAMSHDVFLAVVHATGRRSSYSSKSAERSRGSATENLPHLDSCMN